MATTRPKIVEERLSHIIDELTRRYAPSRIVLFGSHAHGTAAADSDIDLFVEMESSLPPPERAIEISKVFGLRDWPLDVVVYTPREVADLRGKSGTLLSMIEREGVTVYERA